MTQSKIDVANAYERALPLAECWNLADPALVSQYQDLRAWPEKSARWKAMSWDERYEKKAPGLPKGVAQPQDVQRHTNAAEADLWQDARTRLDDGELCIIGFEEPRRLDAAPVLVPAALVKQSKSLSWRAAKIKTGGMIFIECRVLRREDLEASRRPKITERDVETACGALWADGWNPFDHEQNLDMILAELIQRDGKFERGNPDTLKKYIGTARQAAVNDRDGFG